MRRQPVIRPINGQDLGLRAGVRFSPSLIPVFLTMVLTAGLLTAAADGQDASSRVLQASDLPGTFAMAGGDALPSGGYAAVFMRPQILMAPSLPDGALLGVISGVEPEADEEAAHREFLAKADAASIRDTLGPSTPVASETVEALSSEVAGADESVTFRLRYELQGVQLVEYRFRLRVGSWVSSLIVTGRAGSRGQEPAALRRQAQELVDRQAERLALEISDAL